MASVVSMLTRRLVAFVVAVAALAASPAYANKAAEAFVAKVLDEGNPIFALKSETERRQGIDALVGKYVDLDRTGMFVLGQYARVITPEQKAAYTPLFRRYASQIYQNTLSGYGGEKLAVTGSVDRSPRDVIVMTRVVNPSPSSIYAKSVITWRVYIAPDGSMKIFDAGADNLWLAIEQQSTFKSAIANNGGGAAGIDALISELRDKTTGR